MRDFDSGWSHAVLLERKLREWTSTTSKHMIGGNVNSFVAFVVAALCEIAGCFAVWSYFRLGRPAWVLVPGVLLLLLFAYALTRVDTAFAGRAYAAYGGIYVVASILWLRVAEGIRPDRWDILGGVVCLSGTLIIVFGKR